MSAAVISYCAFCVFLAAMVRGYSGFGFSLLTITSLSLALPTAQVVPAIFMLEIAASLHLLPGIWKVIHWKSLAPLIIGTIAATPIGVWFLANIHAAPMQVALAAFVLTATALLWRGFALKTMPGTAATATVGAAAGLANGAFGIGGPPVILFYFATPAGNIGGRASIIFYFLATDAAGLVFQAREGLLTSDAAKLAAMFIVPLLAGIWLGNRSFKTADPVVFRKWVLAILAALAVLTSMKGIYVIAQ